MLQFILTLINGDFLEQLRQHVLFVCESEHLHWSSPKQEGEDLCIENFEHARVEFEHIDLSELPNVVVYRLWQASLEIFKQIGHESGAAGEVQLS